MLASGLSAELERSCFGSGDSTTREQGKTQTRRAFAWLVGGRLDVFGGLVGAVLSGVSWRKKMS